MPAVHSEAATVAGFDPGRRRWITRTEIERGGSVAPLPGLDGELRIDEQAREAVATDLGKITYQRPSAVLRPRSARDIAAMVRFCQAHGLSVSPRGQAHTTCGQGLTEGVVVEMGCLDRIGEIGQESVEVEAGALWKDLAKAAYAHTPRRTPPVLTGYTSLSIGGTLSVGGVGGMVGGLRTGLQVDHVRELEVVTGTGEIVRCSRDIHPDLFDAVRGGLGQCGIITKSVVELVPVKERARTYVLGYQDNAEFFRDLRMLIERPSIDHVYAEFSSPDNIPTYKAFVTVFYDPDRSPDDASILAGVDAEAEVQDVDYLDHVFSIDDLIDPLRETMGWDHLVKPWFDAWLPGSVVEDFIAEVQPGLTADDIGPFGAGLIYPQRREEVSVSQPKLPLPDESGWVFAVDINTVSTSPDPEPGFTDQMLERNGRLLARTREHYGGVLYPIGSVPLSDKDWQAHFGDRWPAFRTAKDRYDPDHVLTPGPGIFSTGGST